MARRFQELRDSSIGSFHHYCGEGLGDDVAAFIETSSRHLDGYYVEGTIRAGLFAVLRMRLPLNWCVQAEQAYPENMGFRSSRADVVVYRPGGEPIVFEVKPDFDPDKIRADLRKISRHVGLATSAVRFGYVVFGYDPESYDYDDLVAEIGAWLDEDRAVQAIPVPLIFHG